jgi:hypothetical protein
MKKAHEKAMALTKRKGGRSLKESISCRLEKLRNSPHKCPLCSETFTGIKALLLHMKDHCT